MVKYKLIYNILKSSFFENFAEFAAWVNERRKVKLRIFATWNMRRPKEVFCDPL